MTLKPHTPKIFSTIQIPCNYNPNATKCPIFNRYIDTLTECNQGKRKILLQFMGAVVSNIKGYRLKKSLFMVGDGDTGKSQAKLLTEKLIGLDNCSGIDLCELEERFGTSNLYNKRLIGSSDMSFISIKELKVFKKITGGDTLFLEFKGHNGFSYIYNGLSWFCMNKLPRFSGDRGIWVYDRMIILKCNNVIPKTQQDKQLLDKMFAEREAIMNILISSVKDVINNGYEFDIPQDCITDNQEYQKNNNIVHLFLEKCTEERQRQDNCTTKVIYNVFKHWCSDNNNGYTISNIEFRQELCNAYKVSNIKDLEKIIKGKHYYKFTLTYETKVNYNIYDNIISPVGCDALF